VTKWDAKWMARIRKATSTRNHGSTAKLRRVLVKCNFNELAFSFKKVFGMMAHGTFNCVNLSVVVSSSQQNK